MESVLRASAIFVFLLLVFRVTGKRSLAQITTFDFVLLLIIGEATQQALLGDDFSVMNAWIVIATLMGLDLLLSQLKHRFPRLDPVIDSVPLVVVADGKLIEERAGHERVDLEDVLAAAREKHGLERLEQIKYAVLERSGGISIIPAPEAR
jgi:uncharacterized membrane protein YcaP (DUF421 family)